LANQGANRSRENVAYRAVYYGVVSVGSIIVLLALWQTLRTSVPYQWLILATLAAFAGSVTVPLPGVKSKVSLSETLVFTSIILFGQSAGIVTATIDGIMGSLRSQSIERRSHFLLFSAATLALASSLAGAVFFYILGQAPVFREPLSGPHHLVPATLALAASYYAVNCVLVSAMIAVDTGKSLLRIWRENFVWATVSYVGGASVAGFLALHAPSLTPGMLGYLVPFMLLTYFAYHAHKDRVSQNLHNQELDRLYIATVEALAMAIDAKDHATAGHANRVLVFSRGMAQAMGLHGPDEIRAIEAAALLHDVGNLAVPDYILNKPGKLSPSEFEKIKIHPVVGARILSTIPFPYPVSAFVRHHHEHWDGSGYPDGLAGEQIPLGARILSVVDAYEALTCDRPYQAASSRETALEVLRSLSGKRFDPVVVACFEQVLDQLTDDLCTMEEKRTTARLLSTDGLNVMPSPVRGAAEGLEDRHPFVDITSTQREELALYELARNLGTSLNLQETLVLVTAEIAKLVPFTTCVVYLCCDGQGRMRAAHVSGLNRAQFQGFAVPKGESVSGWVAANKRPAINADPLLELATIRERLEVPLDNSLVCPLLVEQESLGAIALYGPKDRPFRDDHLRIMELVGAQAASAIQNAMQFEATREGAYTDVLTSLPNSRFLTPQFEQEMQRSRRSQSPLGVLMMDLDGFKRVNDLHGHQAGDRVMVAVARTLRREMRERDLVARWRGDEFVAVMPGTGPKEAQRLSERIRDAIDELRVEVAPGVTVSVGISVGAATYPDDGNLPETLMEKADFAMYRDKRARRLAKAAM
jgi:diguanylate cyclase (GGDEF)-like protein